MTDDDHHEAQFTRIQKAADQLGEQFDSVLILATASNGDTTAHYSGGSGDVFARRGLAAAWLEDQKGYEREKGAARFRRHCVEMGADPLTGD